MDQISELNGFEVSPDNRVKREDRIKKMFYGWDKEMEVIRQMQKVQRNYDHSKSVDPAAIKYLLWHAVNGVPKQHRGHFDIYYTADRKVLDELSQYTWGCTHSRNPPSTWRNSQMNGSLYILYVAKQPNSIFVIPKAKAGEKATRWQDAYISIGISVGLVMRAANSLGYATGFNKSHGDMNGNCFWENKLGILGDVEARKKKIAYGIGIGFPQEGVPRWQSDQTELCIGAGNGSNLTTRDESHPDWRERHPISGRKFRKVKIVDINSVDTAVDPYGNTHEIPDEATIKINSHRQRIINVTELK